MQRVKVKRVFLIGILFIAIVSIAIWLMAYRVQEIIPRRIPELTMKEKAMLNAAWRKHGYYKTVEVEEGCYIERGDGKIWVWRN